MSNGNHVKKSENARSVFAESFHPHRAKAPLTKQSPYPHFPALQSFLPHDTLAMNENNHVH